jgi:hypothetical protein
MHTRRASSHHAEGLSRRALLRRGLAAGLLMFALPLSRPAMLRGVEAGQTLLVKSWLSISNAMGVSFSKGMSPVALAFKRRM